MLLPSDIARLVLGYLQQEGLSATSQAFILESPNLKEYAEHSTDDGTIPACVFSLFGKNLTTILNEYVAAKATETSQEPQIPAMMTSLWKKLEFTLNQIKCMQNSPAVHQNQRLRTRNGIMNLRRQRALSSPLSPAPRIPSSPAPSGHYIPSPISAPQSILGHTAAVCYSSLQTRTTPICQPQVQDGSRLFISVNRDSPLQVAVPEHRINPGPLSPARRKCDSPRRRGGGLSGCSGPGRGSLLPNVPPPELQSESHQEAVSENFPQMVIENAREKILNDKSLQEKLAENINKILGSEISPQASKQAACSSVEQDQSIDEILGLQGEIHMTDDAIQDILEQTESDPAFQALFDLFDCGKDKNSDADHHGDVNTSTPSLESNEAEPSDCFSVTSDQGAGPEDSAPGTETPRKTRTQKVPELKSKKSRKITHPLSSTSRTTQALNPPRPSDEVRPDLPSQMKMSTEGKTLVCDDREARTLQPLPQGSPIKDANPTVVENVPEMPPEEDTSMDVDGPSGATSQENAGQFILQPEFQQIPQASKDPGGRPSRTSPCESERDPSEAGEVNPAERTSEISLDLEAAEVSVLGFSIEVPHVLEHSAEPQIPEASPTLSINTDSAVVNNQKAALEHSPSSQKGSPSLGQAAQGSAATTQEITHLPEDSSASPPEATLSLSSALAPSPAKEHNTSKIVSLKIIISDEQAGDSALCQAVSSITGDQVPTIILSSPAKSPAKAPGGFSVTAEETVQAVSCLQCTELTGKPAEPVAGVDENLQLSLPGELVSEGGFIQLLPSAASYGGSSNYFIVTDQSMVSHSPGVVVLPDGSPLGPVASPTHILATPPRARSISVTQDASKTYPSGSTLIITSPVQPMLQSMMVPASVVSQKNTGTFTIVSNQLVTLPVTSAKVTPSSKSKPRLAPKETAGSGKAGAPVSGLEAKVEIPLRPAVPLLAPQGPGHLTLSDAAITEAAPGPSAPSHRRMLCFDTDSPGHADAAAPSGIAPSPPVTPQTVVSQPPAVSSTSSPAVSASPARQPPKESPGSSGSRCPKIRTVQPTILRGSRAARAELLKCPESLTTPENERPPLDCAAGDTKKSPNAKSDAGLVAKAPSAIVRTEATPAEAPGRSVFARKQQIVDKREFSVAESAGPAKSKPGGAKKEDQRSRTEAGEKPQAKGREGRAERRGSSLEPPHVTANKENRLEGSRCEHHPMGPAPVGEPGPNTIGSPAPISQAGSCKVPNKTSPLTKQAAEMLQDIQGLIPASTPSKRTGLGCSELSHPRTPNLGGAAEEPPDCLRTPIRQRHGREREGTPRHLVATPDVPTCSPASEAGSESSINMAAQTLISLSRAGRAGTPLKDSILQQGVASAAVNIATVAPKAKKRKQSESHTTPTAKKELHLSGSASSKKKSKKQKRLLDSFPDDLDVDKFLSSLHYDE
ncbi:protein NPAT [Brienomyrus brachyistius]|uniref:protein NPAT n=1 Tax=Brienomyrus brachyistius TaxID=42636 RepID=UPI0020B2A4DE|nr:protein NPAT [Brienomyrus brachyistius]